MVNGDCIVTDRHKVGVEIKAEACAEKGYTIIGAPYYCDHRACWIYELKRPEDMNNG